MCFIDVPTPSKDNHCILPEPSMRLALCFVSVIALLVCSGAPEASQSDDLRPLAVRCRRLLDTSVTKFFLPACVDTTHGGYLENWKDGKFVTNGEKFLTQQARTLWFFSTLVREKIEPDAARQAAKAGFTFLQSKFFDKEHGGYFSKVTDAGEIKDPRKHAYLNSFALYALAAYHRATGDAEALQAAQKLFQVLEAKAHDNDHGGYHEFFYRDWKVITDAKEPAYVGPPGQKTYNTHLHLLEAFTELYRVWPDPQVKQRLAELLTINTITVRHPAYACNIDKWQADWQMVMTPQNLRASYGHDVECAWLVLDAARTVGLPTRPYAPWAQSLAAYSLKYGYDPKHGGFAYTGPLGQPADDTKKEWWTQAEALVGMLELYRMTKNPEYLNAFRQTLDFIEKHHVAPGGGWFATRKADGSALSDNRATMWQGPYHTGRALLLSAKLLEELAEKK
jgi:cellobiose epimerase